MRARSAILALSAVAGSVAFGLGAPSAAAVTASPWTPGTIFVADQGAHTGAAGLFAIARDGTRQNLFFGSAVDVATDPAGDVFLASCAQGAVVKIPADGSSEQWLAGSQDCPHAITVEPSGSVLFTAGGALFRVPATEGGTPALVAETDASSLAEDADGDLWLADGAGHLRVIVAGTDEAVTVNRGAYAEQTRSVRFASGNRLLTATAFGQNAVLYSADFETVSRIAYGQGYTTGAVANPAKDSYYLTDDSNGRVGFSKDGHVRTYADGLDDPRGLAIWPATPTGERTGTTTTLATSSTSISTSGRATLTATVVADGGPAAGRVQFSADGRPLGSAALVRNGVASVRTALPLGTDQVTATFLGNGTQRPSQAAPVTFTVHATATSTKVTTSAPASVPQSQPVDVTVRVSSGHGTPSGIALVMVNGTTRGVASLDADGVGTASVPLEPGHNVIRAFFSGDDYYGASRSDGLALTAVAPYAATMTTRATYGDPDQDGNVPATITVHVKGISRKPLPTGTITADNGLVCGSLVPTANGTSTTATCTATLAPGFYDVTVGYSGDETYAATTIDQPLFVFGGGGEGGKGGKG